VVSNGRSALLGALLALALPACRSRHAPAPIEAATRWPVPSSDDGDSCEDVIDVRVCWDARGVHRVARSLPPFPPPTPLDFRCVGSGSARVCEGRVGAFECSEGTCTQKHPRQPDDGEWSCADDRGATVCVGSVPPAGVLAEAVALGWMCGPRRVHRPDPLGERVCVDLSPDFPNGSRSLITCRWDYEHGVRRVCSLDPQAHATGDPCDGAHPCVRGTLCADARCVPPEPHPSCWLDRDCGEGSCDFGTCREASR